MDFRPPRGISNAHAQTLLGRASRARRARSGPEPERVRIDTPDGDFLDLHIRPLASRPRAVCLLLHGLEGCARSGYIVTTAEALAQRRILPVGLDFRSCGEEPNRTAGSYHSGRTDDIVTALAWLRERHPALPRAAVGFSLGGNALLVHLGCPGVDERHSGDAAGRPDVAVDLSAAAAVSVPFDLAACAAALERGINRLYGRFFLRTLREKARAKAARFPGLVSPEAASARTLREFDERLTAPVHGFAGADDYYARCSSARFLDSVTVPTLLIQASDDPLVPAGSVPRARIAANPHLTLELTPRGGHVGFVDRSRGAGPEGWLETRIARFIESRTVPATESPPAPENSPAAEVSTAREQVG